MRNKYQAMCFVCHRVVDVGAGETNMFNGKWLTRHEGDPRCIKRDKPVLPSPSFVYTSEDRSWIEDNFTNAEFEDAMGIGWER